MMITMCLVHKVTKGFFLVWFSANKAQTYLLLVIIHYLSFLGEKVELCVWGHTPCWPLSKLMNTIMYTILLNSELVVNSIIYREQINWHIYLSTFVPQVCYVQSTRPIHLLDKLRYRRHGLHCGCWHCLLGCPSIKMLTGCPRDVWQGLKMS